MLLPEIAQRRSVHVYMYDQKIKQDVNKSNLNHKLRSIYSKLCAARERKPERLFSQMQMGESTKTGSYQFSNHNGGAMMNKN